jgi:hypothetical protein
MQTFTESKANFRRFLAQDQFADVTQFEIIMHSYPDMFMKWALMFSEKQVLRLLGASEQEIETAKPRDHSLYAGLPSILLLDVLAWLNPLSSLHHVADKIIYQPGVTEDGKDYMVVKCPKHHQVYISGHVFPYKTIPRATEGFLHLCMGNERMHMVVDPSHFEDKELNLIRMGVQLTGRNEYSIFKQLGRQQGDMDLFFFANVLFEGVHQIENFYFNRCDRTAEYVPIILTVYSAILRLVTRYQKDRIEAGCKDLAFRQAYGELLITSRIYECRKKSEERLQYFGAERPLFRAYAAPDASHAQEPKAKCSRIE